MRTWLLLLTLLQLNSIAAQRLTNLHTQWDDSFAEWGLIAFVEGEETEGNLELRWQLPDDWSDWEYRLGEQFGRIKMKWQGNPNEWEIRGDNQIVSLRTVWNNDYREWKISGAGVRLTIFSRYGTVAEEWAIREDTYGHFEMYSAWEGDPRDWVITDDLEEAVSLPVKMGLVFAVIFSSTPKQ